MTHARQDRGCLGLVLGAMVHHMQHRLPKRSLVWISLCRYVAELSVKSLLGQPRDEIHEIGALLRPASLKGFESRELLLFQPGIAGRSLPALTPDPLGEQGVDKCSAQASVRERCRRKELFLG